MSPGKQRPQRTQILTGDDKHGTAPIEKGVLSAPASVHADDGMTVAVHGLFYLLQPG